MVNQASEQVANQQTAKAITVSRQCQFIKANGERCQAKCCADSSYCYFHSPELAEKRHAARRLGGLHRYATGQPGDYQIESPNDVLAVLVDSLNEATALPNTCGKAKAIAALVTVLLKGFEASVLHERIQALEKRLSGGP